MKTIEITQHELQQAIKLGNMNFENNITLTPEQRLTLAEKLNKFLNEEIYSDNIIEEVEDELDIYRMFIEYFEDIVREG
jgi:hypothetical protein